FGAALLLDVHSMPPIDGPDAARIVIGDRFGVSAGSWLTDTAAAVLSGASLRVAVNTPYSGGHILARHAAPELGLHALQIEVDRGLYLDAAFDAPGAGMTAMAGLIARLVFALSNQLGAGEAALAAE
ncbi:MAG: N-formylglutamate amidohydrolase, partial [Sphingomonadaceae bacterium]|nr:N-formylglutamate amidohydrolase [Sphingomonadaceae bacterium]